MKYAIVEAQRCEAAPGLSAECPVCHGAMTAKCGECRVWHWAHRQERTCDRWWESETEWHRRWKDEFPREWQEFVQLAEDGEKHVADVKTAHGWAIEFQHSHLRPDERRAREAFYKQVVWVVDGLRRKRDRPLFFRALQQGARVSGAPLIWAVFSTECALLRDWVDSRAPVFFDFCASNDPTEGPHFTEPVLWRLDQRSSKGRAYLAPVRRRNFIEAFRMGAPCKAIALRVARSKPQAVLRVTAPPRGPKALSFQQYLAQRARLRRRF